MEVHFVLGAHNEVGFRVGDYDRSRKLVIDPSVGYATYLGGAFEDEGNAIAIDSTGNVYITGETTSTNFPIVPGSYRTTNAGGNDVFVTKISADGSTLLFLFHLRWRQRQRCRKRDCRGLLRRCVRRRSNGLNHGLPNHEWGASDRKSVV